ncbi:MAG: DNA polymerase/3'-5' exonuclease PolX [Planctomycetota bacterium]|jgi:DNA polymerase (family 10)
MASTNEELVRVFNEMAALLEITGASVFRINAHHRVAEILRDLPTDVATLAGDPARLTAIEGIGDGSAKRIVEYVRTGAVAEHQKLRQKVPVGLLEVMRIPGLGPKTVRLLWEKAGVTDLDSLKAALEAGTLEDLPRMGAKSIENIRKSLAFAEQAGQRMRLGTAMPLAEAIVARLADVPGVEHVEFAGSLRRGRETIGDLDIIAATDDPAVLSEAFRGLEDVEEVLLAGDTKVSVRLRQGVQADLRMVDESELGAALMYFTGSKDHNVVLRERAIKRGMRLNEYGLFAADDATGRGRPTTEPLVSRSEEEIYTALELPWIPPELRENRGELDGPPPDLLSLEDIRCELHAHTVASDGGLSIEDLARCAKQRGFHTIAVTDHSKSSVQANGLSPERLREHIEAIRAADAKIKGISILAGSEVDILVGGGLDYDDDLLAELDIVVASPHAALSQDPEKATKRLLAAIAHPLVHVLGHPTGRLIGRRRGLSPDIDALVAAAAEHDTALEINANSYRLDLRDAHVRAAVQAGALIAIDTDAHHVDDFDQLRYGVLTGRRGWLTKDLCINTWTKRKLHSWLKAKRT